MFLFCISFVSGKNSQQNWMWYRVILYFKLSFLHALLPSYYLILDWGLYIIISLPCIIIVSYPHIVHLKQLSLKIILRIFLYYINKTGFTFHLVTALANKKFPEDDDCATYGRLTSDIFSVQSRALTSASDYLSNQDASIISNTSNPEPSLEEKMWSAMALDSPTQPLPLVQKRENFFY